MQVSSLQRSAILEWLSQNEFPTQRSCWPQGSLPFPLSLPEFAQPSLHSCWNPGLAQGQNGVNKGEVGTFVQVSLYLSPPPFPEVLPFPSLFSCKGELWIITTRELTPLVRPSFSLCSAVLHFAQSNLDLSYFPQSIDSQQKGIRVEIG